MSTKLIEQGQEASLKSHRYEMEGKVILAAYWRRKAKKYANMKKLATALVKRDLLANGIKRLNTIKI